MPFDAATLRQQFPILRTPGLHYLDNAATAQIPECVLASLVRFEREQRANVHGGVHRLARAAIEAYEGARATLAHTFGASCPEEIVFTYGTTAAINLVAQSFGELLQAGDEILLSELEHHSNLLPWQALARRRGVQLRFLPVTPEGRLNLGMLDTMVTKRCKLVALTHASNVTGALTPLAPIVAAARSVGAKILLDGAQRMPHELIDLQAMGVDFYAFSGHKMYGPTGIGGLWGRLDLLEAMPPFLVGGQMVERVTLQEADFAPPPHRFEAGTPPIAQAVGLGAAADWMARQDWSAIRSHQQRLTARVIDGFRAVKGIRLIGPDSLELRGGVVSFDVPGQFLPDICQRLDQCGVALRHGRHCAQPLFQALGIKGALRASLAPYSDDSDVDALLIGLEEAC